MTEAAEDYANLPLGRFLEMTASREPAPGGGSAAAITVALAAALTGMAARFSTDGLADAETVAVRADELRSRATALARADADAYGRVLDARRASRDDEEERRRRVREAMSEAADVPLAVAGIGAEVAGFAVRMAEEGNRNLRGDALTAVALAVAGVRAAVALVEINISAGGDDGERLSRAERFLAATTAAQEDAEARSGGLT